MVHVPNQALWIATGNNTRLSPEIIRRTIWCRLDARTHQPWQRKQFRHRNLLQWVRENRHRLVTAVLTLCRCWVAAGKPQGTHTLGMFESWASVLGGILEVAGIPGLLVNLQELARTRSDQSFEWQAMVRLWWEHFGEATVGVDRLFCMVQSEKLLDEVIGDKSEQSQRTKLGMALTRVIDRVFGTYRIEADEVDRCGRKQFRLQALDREEQSPCSEMDVPDCASS